MISVFTPSHDPKYLNDCLASLLAQTYTDWEWVVLLNHEATWEEIDDPRVRVLRNDEVEGVGAAKQAVVTACRGDILVELDHDDILASTALERVTEAFEAFPDAGLVYSQCAQVTEALERDNTMYDLAYGWEYKEATVDGRVVQYPITMAPTPHNVCYIWYAPNHLRAFSRVAYDKSGGYDPARTVLDDQDLMCRLYQIGDFHLIDECLYLQRAHGANTQADGQTNAKIQVETVALYDGYIEVCALAWARRVGLLALDLGSYQNKRPGYLGVDKRRGEGVDVVTELPKRLPFGDSSIGVIRAMDFLEHVEDKIALINELYRVLAPNGLLLSMTPSTDGRGAYQDPTHIAYYNENSFWYYTDANLQRYAPEITARFQVSRLVTTFPSEWHQQHTIPYVTANMVALKDGPRQGGILSW
jgi:glycosyltransferase involved in cell wall biosynthesis